VYGLIANVELNSELLRSHLKVLKLQGKSKSTIDAYSRAVRRIRNHYDGWPDKLTKDQLENYFVDLVESHSWSTVKIDRLGLMFFWKFVLNRDWQWLNIVASVHSEW
jgi:site-specific recombinase XerD